MILGIPLGGFLGFESLLTFLSISLHLNSCNTFELNYSPSMLMVPTNGLIMGPITCASSVRTRLSAVSETWSRHTFNVEPKISILCRHTRTHHDGMIVTESSGHFNLGVSDIFFIQYVTGTSHALQVLYLSPLLSFSCPAMKPASQYSDPFIS